MPNRVRNKPLYILLSDSEYLALEEKCKVTGLSKAGILRHYIMDIPVKPRPTDSYKDLVQAIGAIGNNLNQIAHIANMSGHIQAEQAAEALAIVKEMSERVRMEL